MYRVAVVGRFRSFPEPPARTLGARLYDVMAAVLAIIATVLYVPAVVASYLLIAWAMSGF